VDGLSGEKDKRGGEDISSSLFQTGGILQRFCSISTREIGNSRVKTTDHLQALSPCGQEFMDKLWIIFFLLSTTSRVTAVLCVIIVFQPTVHDSAAQDLFWFAGKPL
jgi:hypothetical protein